ncbi:MAG: DUF4349 domain-containing protein [Oligoflexia bacterium]|nr:DUF4349 domain-containing protein [Oligoflexia bacterium]
MVFYDGYARLRVARVDQGIDQIRAVATEVGGHVERVAGNSITVRVPVATFSDAFDRVLHLGEVLDRSISARDVTNAFTAVDLRLSTAQAALSRLQALLAQSQDDAEKLTLIKQIQELTERIDLLQAQVRTLSSLAKMSRLSVDLVPRQALAWQDSQDETAELAWIRRLSPLLTEPPLAARPLLIDVPTGMVRLDDTASGQGAAENSTVAEGPDGARIWSWRTRNQPQGDAAFWLAALDGRLASDFGKAETLTIGEWQGEWQVLRLVDRGDDPYTWLIAVRVTGHFLDVVQAMTPDPTATERYEAALRAVLLSAGGAS